MRSSREAPTTAAPLLRALAEALGSDHVLTGDSAEPYAWDALGPGRGFRRYPQLHSHPLCVARPAATQEVAAIVLLAGEHRTPVVPYGGGSGLMGGALALESSIVIDLTRMDRVLEVSREDQLVRAQAGIVLGVLGEALAPHGLILGHDPWTVPVATVGGAIATDSLGYRGAKYGSMGEQVLGLTAVLPDGSVISTRPVRKRSTGPDPRHLFVGSEGCFGIVTEATLRVFPQPETRSLLACEFPSFEAGFRALISMWQAGLTPALLDYGESYGEAAESTLYLGFEGFREEVQAQQARARRACEEAGARDLGGEEAQHFWDHRHDIALRFAEGRRAGLRQALGGGTFDFIHVSIRPSRVLEYREACAAIAGRHRVQVREFGLWCWPELFSAVLAHPDGDAGREPMAAAVDEMLALAQDWHGSMEYCHGAGVRLAHLMDREHGRGLDALGVIKRSLDPLGIMNPGKLAL